MIEIIILVLTILIVWKILYLRRRLIEDCFKIKKVSSAEAVKRVEDDIPGKVYHKERRLYAAVKIVNGKRECEDFKTWRECINWLKK